VPIGTTDAPQHNTKRTKQTDQVSIVTTTQTQHSDIPFVTILSEDT